MALLRPEEEAKVREWFAALERPVELLVAPEVRVAEAESVPPFLAVDPNDAWEPPTSLFGDTER